MNVKSLAIGLAGLVFASAATPALSQGISIGPDGVQILENTDRIDRRGRPSERRARAEVSEREAIRIARGEGLREVENVRRTRDAYRVVGLDRRGDDIRVDVDRRSGEVLSVR